MRILFVSSSRKGKGISPFILSQGESLKQRGLEIEYFLIEGSGLLNYTLSILTIRKKLNTIKYDLIHAHFGFSGIVARLSSFHHKLVVSFLGDDLEGSIGANGQYTFLSKIIVKINFFFAKYFYDYSIVKSKNLKIKISSVNNSVILPNGVNIEKYDVINREEARSKLNLDSKKRYILFAGSPKRNVKNVKLFNDSIKYWENNCEPLYLENVEPETVVYYYNAVDVTVLTSIHEGSPNIIKEAMSCNCPIVSTNVGDVEWVIGDTKGCFTTSFDSKDVAFKIKKAIKFSNDYRRTTGRERVIELGLDSETVAKKIIEVYKNVLIS